jgi:hypothetical protein
MNVEKHYDRVFLHLASPTVGNDVRRLVREVATLAGVARVAPGSRASNLLRVDYDPALISTRTLLARARRGWVAVRKVGMHGWRTTQEQSTPVRVLQASHVIPK